MNLPSTMEEAEALLAQMAEATLTAQSVASVGERPEVVLEEAATLLADQGGTVLWLSSGATRLLGDVKGRNTADLALRPLAVEEMSLGGASYQLVILSDGEHRSEALARAQARFQTLVEQIPAVTFAGNLDERASELYVGPQIEAMLGYSQKEWLSNPILWYRQLHPEDHGILNQEFMRGCLTDGRFKAQCRFFARDGSTVWVHGEARLIRDAEGNPTTLQGVAFDITEIKRAEELIRHTLEEKEQLLQDLEIAHAAALESARLKSQFLANTSHELRTPLNGVIGLTHVLKTTNLDPQQQEYIQTIRACGELLLSTINDILDFEKSSAHKMTLEVIDLDLHQLVEEVIGMMAEPAHQKKLELFSLVYHEVPTRLQGDPGRLRQILLNLVGNAVKFTDQGEVIVRVRPISEVESPPGTVLMRFEIVDTGIGLSDDQTKMLFQPFVQADGSMTRRFGGTGLGLAICKQLADLMGGDIGVDSELGRGSTFWFTVRLNVNNQRAFEPATGIIGRRVLVVDDEETQLEVATAQLKGWKMRPDVARDGLQGITMLRSAARAQDPYALVLADLLMPGLSGTELARMVASEPELAGTRVVVITGYRDRVRDSDKVHLAAALSKPVAQSQLYNVIAEVLLGERRVNLASTGVGKPLNAHVLLVEDNEVNQQVAMQVLKVLLGCRVLLAENGSVALEKLQEGQFDVVLMDCQMPVMDGFTATAAIRARDRETGKHTPIVAMTAHALTGDRERCLEAGMDDYITKPLVPEDLRRALERWVGDGEASPAAEILPLGDDEEVTLDGKVISRLEMLAEGDQDFLRRLQSAFGDSVAQGRRDLSSSLQAQDVVGLKKAAHTLTGAASNFGARKISRVCSQIEVLAERGELESVQALVDQIESLAEQAVKTFQTLLLT